MVMAFFSAEMVIYFLFKIAKGDYFHWLRLNGWLAVVVSMLERFFGKIVLDFR